MLLAKVASAASDLYRSAMIVSFFVFVLCRIRQNSSKFTLDRFEWTTFNAASFSETKRIFLPLEINSAIIFVIVWLFPVPGGPWITKLSPALANSIAFNWLLSASTTIIFVFDVDIMSRFFSIFSTEFSLILMLNGPPEIADTYLSSNKDSKLFLISLYIAIFEKAKMPT